MFPSPDGRIASVCRKGRWRDLQAADVALGVEPGPEWQHHEREELTESVRKASPVLRQRCASTYDDLEGLGGATGHLANDVIRCPEGESAPSELLGVMRQVAEEGRRGAKSARCLQEEPKGGWQQLDASAEDARQNGRHILSGQQLGPSGAVRPTRVSIRVHERRGSHAADVVDRRWCRARVAEHPRHHAQMSREAHDLEVGRIGEQTGVDERVSDARNARKEAVCQPVLSREKRRV
jgi:hypothetical protein